MTCKYTVQQLEFLDKKPRKTWGQNWTVSVGCPSQGLFALYHHYPKKGLPVPQSGHCRLKEVSGSSLTPGDMNRIWQGVRRSSSKHPQQLSFSLPPLLNLSTLWVPLLSLKDDLTMSSSNSDIFSSEFPLPFHSPSDVSWVSLHMCSWSHFPSPPFGTLFHFFDTQSFLSWSKTFNIIFILEKKSPSSDHSASLHHADFQRGCFILAALDIDHVLASHSFLVVQLWCHGALLRDAVQHNRMRMRFGFRKRGLSFWINYLLPEPHFLHRIFYEYQMS